MTEQRGVLLLDGWAGRLTVPVVIVGETPKRYRVRLEADALLPSRRRCAAGDVVLVPKYAVKLVAAADQAGGNDGGR